MTGDEKSQEKKQEGLTSGVVQSLKEHVDERLRSPFGGAFVLAWLVVNWQGVAIMLLSDLAIEERIRQVSDGYVDWYSGLVLPMLLAVFFTVGFYLISSVFVILIEAYELAKRRIRRWYDDKTWVPPERYVALKVRLNGEIRYLQDLAADNISAVEAERLKTKEATDRLLKLQTEAAESAGGVARAAEEKNEVLSDLQKERKKSADRARQLESLLKENETREVLARELITDIRQYQLSDELVDSDGRLGAFILTIREKLLRIAGSVDGIPDGPINEHALAFYLKERFDQPVKADLLRKLLADLERSEISDHVSTLSDVHEVINRAMPALIVYKAERPDLFTSSVDYLSKALGFVFPRFRSFHSYSKATVDAFKRHQDRVSQ